MSIDLYSPTSAQASVVIDAVWCRSRAQDEGNPILPAVHAVLAPSGGCMLAPVLDSLVILFESCSGQVFRSGRTGVAGISGDEYRLLTMLQKPGVARQSFPAWLPAAEQLSSAMAVAVRSSRIMLQLVFPSLTHIEYGHSLVAS